MARYPILPRPIIGLLVLIGLLLHAAGQTQTEPATGGAQLRVATDPPGARIYRNGVLQDTAPITITDIAPGTHLIVARLTNHREARATVVIEPGQRLPLDLTLEPITGLVLVRSTPPGADVTVNGAHRGRTPLLLTDLPVGRHRAATALPGYLPMEVDIVVQDRIPQKVALTLRPDSARFRFESQPRAARVFINGILRGTTPCEVDRVPTGECEVEIQLEGHRPFNQQFQLRAGDTHDVRVVLEPLPGALRLISVPAGAQIYVNNEPRGETPLLIEGLPPGTYRVRAETRGYTVQTADLVVRHDTVTPREFRLERDSGSIVLTTEPAGVRVLIDGEEAGITAPGESDVLSRPLTIDLIAQGERRIQLAREGYYPLIVQVEIEAGKTMTRHERLRRRFIPDTRIRIGDGPRDVLTGIIKQRHPNGDIEIEIRPGIFQTIERERIRAIEPITVQPPR